MLPPLRWVFMDDIRLSMLFYYCKQGWPIFPINWIENGMCSCGAVNCQSPGKHPLVNGGFYTASTDIELIEQWHGRWPDANWGLRTGDKQAGGAGIIVLDIDNKTDGFITWDLLREENPGLIQTVMVSTGNGGQHLWFVHPSGVEIRSGAGVLGRGIDIRADFGYVLLPPSKTSLQYKFELNPSDTEISEMPEWIKDKVNGHPKMNTKYHLPAAVKLGPVVNQGTRHQALTSIAGSLKKTGLEEDEIRATLHIIRDERFSEGDHTVSDEEIDGVVDWIKNKTLEFPFTDLGNAERFLSQHKNKVRYCFAWEKWLSWDGRRWMIDDKAEVYRLAHETIRSIYIEASNEKDNEKRRAIAKHAFNSEARSRIVNMLDCAKYYLPVRVDELDVDPMLFNVSNGTIDLRTGNLLPHDPLNMITKISKINYLPEATCPEWESSLEFINAGNMENIYFLQKAIGYTLTGNIDEHSLFFLYGGGVNGKSTFVETIRRLLGEYAQKINVEALMTSWNMGTTASPFVAAMAGARFVLASEIEERRKINDAVIKDLTGGDVITARFLFSNPFTFKPTHKIWLYGNHKPVVSDSSLGFWRRIRLVPFLVSIPDDVKKPMGEMLTTFDREMSGILTWAVTGCLMWQSAGLKMPEVISKATLEYRDEEDLVQQFLDDKCELHPDFTVEKDKLFTAWRDWCKDQGEEHSVRTQRWLSQQIIRHGFRHQGGGRLSLAGLHLKGNA